MILIGFLLLPLREIPKGQGMFCYRDVSTTESSTAEAWMAEIGA